MFDPLFGAMLWSMVLCVVMPFVVRLIRWRRLRLLIMILLLAQVAVGIGIMIIEPYSLEAITNRSGRSISNPNLVVNPQISWLFLASIVTGWSLLFTRVPEKGGLWSDRTEIVVAVLLLAAGFYFWCFNSIKWMDDEKREKIYYELGGYGRSLPLRELRELDAIRSFDLGDIAASS